MSVDTQQRNSVVSIQGSSRVFGLEISGFVPAVSSISTVPTFSCLIGLRVGFHCMGRPSRVCEAPSPPSESARSVHASTRA